MISLVIEVISNYVVDIKKVASIEDDAVTLYYLFHQRYIFSENGLSDMVRLFTFHYLLSRERNMKRIHMAIVPVTSVTKFHLFQYWYELCFIYRWVSHPKLGDI